MNIIQPSRKTRGCSWDGGQCVFLNIDTGDCNLYEEIDWLKSQGARMIGICQANFTAEEMLEKLGLQFEPSGIDPKHKIHFR